MVSLWAAVRSSSGLVLSLTSASNCSGGMPQIPVTAPLTEPPIAAAQPSASTVLPKTPARAAPSATNPAIAATKARMASRPPIAAVLYFLASPQLPLLVTAPDTLPPTATHAVDQI